MRIALLHSYYRSGQPSGENVVVDRLAAALRDHGHTVTIIGRHSDELTGTPLQAARTAWNVATGHGYDPSAELTAAAPDVVHVHNLFPNFGTSWLRTWDGAVVATLHNYRTICANGLLLRDGRECTECPDSRSWAAVRHGCYRGSHVASLPLALRNRRGLVADPLVARADRVIVLSARAQRIFHKYGMQDERTRLVPNGVQDLPLPQSEPGSERWVGVGRLSAEKDWAWLVSLWPRDRALDIYGAGDLEDSLKAQSGPSVEFAGVVDHGDLRRRLPLYAGALFAGVNPEGAYPLAAVEALAAGVPLVARRGGAAADMVQAWGCGSVFSGGDDLADAMASARTPECRQRARSAYEENFREDPWVDRLVEVYGEAIQVRGGR